MLRARLVELLLFALAGACALYGFGPPRSVFGYAPPARPQAGLRIVTWNIGVASRGETAGDRDVVSRDEQLARVSETLVELDADVMVLQEVGRREMERVAAAFSDTRTAFTESSGGGCAVIVQRGRLVQLDVEDWAEREPVHIIYRPRRGPAVQLIGLHADPWSASARNMQVGRAVTLLSETGPLPIQVLAGDLNLDVDLGGGKDLFTEDEYLDVQTYNYAAERMDDAAAGAGPTAEPDRRLDYIFVTGGGAQVDDAGVWRGRRLGGMDHHPVVVDLGR